MQVLFWHRHEADTQSTRSKTIITILLFLVGRYGFEPDPYLLIVISISISQVWLSSVLPLAVTTRLQATWLARIAKNSASTTTFVPSSASERTMRRTKRCIRLPNKLWLPRGKYFDHLKRNWPCSLRSETILCGNPYHLVLNHALHFHRVESFCSAQKAATRDGITCPLDAAKELKESLPDWATNFYFSGSLRPSLLSPKRVMPQNIRRPDYADHFAGVSESEQRDKRNHNNIRVYTEKELDAEYGLRHACKMGREVLDAAGKALRVGVTTDEIDRVVHEACIERDCYPSPLNYYK